MNYRDAVIFYNYIYEYIIAIIKAAQARANTLYTRGLRPETALHGIEKKTKKNRLDSRTLEGWIFSPTTLIRILGFKKIQVGRKTELLTKFRGFWWAGFFSDSYGFLD